MTRFTGAHYCALALLDSCQDGCTEPTMLAHGHSIETLVHLIRADLASVQTEHWGRGSLNHNGSSPGSAGEAAKV
jgi:hypothetical protein